MRRDPDYSDYQAFIAQARARRSIDLGDVIATWLRLARRTLGTALRGLVLAGVAKRRTTT